MRLLPLGHCCSEPHGLDLIIIYSTARHAPSFAEFKGTVVAVTHDRYFLDNVAGWILELDRGQGIPFEGNYSEWLRAKDKRLAVCRTNHWSKSLSIQSVRIKGNV